MVVSCAGLSANKNNDSNNDSVIGCTFEINLSDCVLRIIYFLINFSSSSAFTGEVLWSISSEKYFRSYECVQAFCRIPLLGDIPSEDLYLHQTAQHKKSQALVCSVAFEPTFPVFERSGSEIISVILLKQCEL